MMQWLYSYYSLTPTHTQCTLNYNIALRKKCHGSSAQNIADELLCDLNVKEPIDTKKFQLQCGVQFL